MVDFDKEFTRQTRTLLAWGAILMFVAFVAVFLIIGE